MKIKIALAMVAMFLVGAADAQAQSNDYSVVVTPNPISITNAGIADQPFNAVITNLTNSPQLLFGDSIGNLPNSVGVLNDYFAYFLSNRGPIQLAPGASVSLGPGGIAPDAFDLAIGPNTPSFIGDLTVTDGYNGNNINSSGDGSPGNPFGNFTVSNTSMAATPEPGSLALLAGGALGSGALILRRRRK